MIEFKQALPRLEATPSPEPQLIREVFDAILRGGWSATQIAAFAIALRVKGETPEVIAEAAKALREHMVPLPHQRTNCLDTCGTGGDGLGSLNISTGAAIIAAAAGAPVAKHGNRAVSSRSGSADVLESLGLRLEMSTERASAIFAEVGIVFLFAQSHHPAMRHVGPARRELGVRTIFNCLGPLASPARVTHQLLGAYDDALRPILAQTLAELGVERAWVVRGVNGMDELNPFGETRVSVLSAGRIEERVLRPEDFGISPCPPGATDGGDASDNARILTQVLEGEAHPSADVFLLNAAGALCVYYDLEPRQGAERAREALVSGQARLKLNEWRDATLRSS